MYTYPRTSWFGEHKVLTAVLVVVFLAALGFGGWGLWQMLAPVPGDPRAQLTSLRRDNGRLRNEAERLRQRVVTLTRSDQISRDANRDLQGALADRDEEIAGLRADVAFYERLVGATAQRRGLSVHALRLQRQNDAAWHFTTTLTQNLNRGAVSQGTLTLVIEGSRDGQLQKLGWGDLRQQADAPAVGYSFKYFQQVEGDVFLPEGVTPVKVTVRLQPRSGAPIEQSFSWTAATGIPAVGEQAPMLSE